MGDGRNHAGPSHSVPSKPRVKAIVGILPRLLPRLYEERIPTGDLGTPEDDGVSEASTWASAVNHSMTNAQGRYVHGHLSLGPLRSL